MTTNGNGIYLFLAGSFLGAGIALLFAPQSGRKTRRDIVRLGRAARNRAEQAIDDATEAITEKLSEQLDRGKEWTQSLRSGVQHAMSSAKNLIQ